MTTAQLVVALVVWFAALAAAVQWNRREGRAEVPQPTLATPSMHPEDADRLQRAERNAKLALAAVEELEADVKRKFGKLYAQQRREEPETELPPADPAQTSLPLTPKAGAPRMRPRSSFSGNSRP